MRFSKKTYSLAFAAVALALVCGQLCVHAQSLHYAFCPDHHAEHHDEPALDEIHEDCTICQFGYLSAYMFRPSLAPTSHLGIRAQSLLPLKAIATDTFPILALSPNNSPPVV